MAVTLVRHTRPEGASGLCYGMTDLGLADSFEADAQVVLSNLPRASSLVTSPLSRCHLLAQRIGAAIGQVPQIAQDWREMDFGTWEGLAWDDVPRAGLDAWAADFHHYKGHGGESVADLEARIRRALADTPQDALVVTHAGCIKAAMAIAGQGAGWQARPNFGETVSLDQVGRPAKASH